MKFLRNTSEKMLGTFAEGPEAPPRIRELVEVFAKANPRATVGEWVEFAVKHAEGAYQQGYVRGFERTERLGPDWEDPDEAAKVMEQIEDIAAGNDQGFDASAVVPIDGVPKEHAARAALAMNDLVVEQGFRRGPPRR
jgi:hypothetical protein